jgi:hypothetical protein
MKKVFLASLFVLLPMSALAQTESSPARKAGVCYAALSLQSPQPTGELQKRSEFTKHQALWDKSFNQCRQQGVDPANAQAFKSCMSSNGISNNTFEYMAGYINTSSFIKKNRPPNSEIGAMAVSYCTF